MQDAGCPSNSTGSLKRTSSTFHDNTEVLKRRRLTSPLQLPTVRRSAFLLLGNPCCINLEALQLHGAVPFLHLLFWPMAYPVNLKVVIVITALLEGLNHSQVDSSVSLRRNLCNRCQNRQG